MRRVTATAAACLVLLLAAARAAPAAAQQQQQQKGQEDCDASAAPAPPAAVKALVTGDTTVDVLWLPPTSGGCVTGFTVTAKDVATGAQAGSQQADKELRASFEGLKPGATYEFSVAPSGPAGGGGAATGRAAMPPATLDVTPDAPEALASAATGGESARLTWQKPAGNPQVDYYRIQVVAVNATGYPLVGGKNYTARASGGATSVVLKGLKPGGYYVFAVKSVSDARGESAEPAVSFQRMPRDGESPPEAPGDLRAAAGGQKGAVLLQWKAPGGSEPDFYQIGVTEVDGSGKALSATNIIPYKNTTAVIKDLTPGATYQFDVQSYSAAFNDGKATRVTYAVPPSYSAPSAAPPSPQDLQAKVYGNEVQLFWKDPGAPSYLVTAHDAYSGRALGVSYRTQGGWISVPGLPVGSPVLLSVQGSSKDGAALSEPATVTVEIPAPQTPVYQGGGGYYGGGYYGGGYYDSYYSPYAGYNPYMPYWYSSYYPVQWYNTWYPGKWILNGLWGCLRPFNHFWGFGWWGYRPWGWGMWNILNPFKPWLGGGWGYGGLWGRGGWYGNGWNYGGSYWRDRGLRPAGGFGGGDLINKLPGQLARPSTRPAIIDNVVRPGNYRPTTRPAPGLERPVGGGGPTTRPAPGLERPVLGGGGGNGPTTRPAPGFERPVGGGTVTNPTLRPAPGVVDGGSALTRPAIGQLPTTRPSMPTMPTTRPSMPTMPTTRPAMPTMPAMPTTRPSFGGNPSFGGWGGGGGSGFSRPATRPSFGGSGGFSRPAGGGFGSRGPAMAMPLRDFRGRLRRLLGAF